MAKNGLALATRAANPVARIVVAAIFLLGFVVVVWPAMQHIDLDADPFSPTDSVTRTVTKVDVDGRVSTQRTTSPGPERSVLNQALAPGGLILLRVAAVAAAAFLAGAVVQRTLLADFAFKAGGLEVGAPAASADAASTLAEGQARQAAEIAKALRALGQVAGRVDQLERRTRQAGAARGSRSSR